MARNIEERGGLQRVLHLLGRSFAERGHDVELIGIYRADGPAAPPPRDPPYRTVTLSRWKEPIAWRPQTAPGRFDLRQWERDARRRWLHRRNVAALSARFARVPSGIVISGQVGPMEWIADAETSHLRIVGMSHESYYASRHILPPPPSPSRYERIMRYFPLVDETLLLTEADAEQFRRDGLTNVSVMPNPLPFWPEKPSPLTAPVVVGIGRLEEQKRFDLLLRAWRSVVDRRPDWQLRIYGEGSDRPMLESLIGELGLRENASLMGATEDVASALADASMLALSSDYEGLPLTLLEAMASGVPCVAFDCAPGIREVIADEVDGLVVPPGDVEALGGSILRLIDDAPLRQHLGSAARRDIQRYSLPAVLQRWEELFERLDRM